MYEIARQADATTTEQELKDAGFRAEKVGGTTVFERDVPDSVVEATRVLIRSNVKAKADVNGNNGKNKDAAVSTR